MTRPSVQIDVSFEDQTAERVFGALEPDLSTSLWPQRAERTDNPSHYVHVVAASGCRLELGQELSKDKIEEIMGLNQKEVFVLTLHLGMRAPPIQFTSPYGDRIKIGQVVYTDRRAPLLELVPEAEGAPLSVCKSKFDAFLHNGGGDNGGEVGSHSNRSNNSTINNSYYNKSDKDLEACEGFAAQVDNKHANARREGAGPSGKSQIAWFVTILSWPAIFVYIHARLSCDLPTLPYLPAFCLPPCLWFFSSASTSFGLSASASPECSPSTASLGAPVESPHSLPPAPVPPAPSPFAVRDYELWICRSNASQPLSPVTSIERRTHTKPKEDIRRVRSNPP